MMFLCRNHSEIQTFQVHFSVFQLYLMCFLNFQKCFHLTDRGKRNGQGFSWMWRFSTLCCACSGSLLPPASKWDPTGRSLLQRQEQDRVKREWNGVCPSVTGEVLMCLFRYWNHSKPSFTVSLFHGIKTKVKTPTKTCVIQQAYRFFKFQKSGLDSLWCFYFLNYFVSTPV